MITIVYRAVKLLKSNRSEFLASVVQHFFGWLPDAIYLKLLYRFKMGHRLDLKNPKTFTEKLQWLKLYNRKPEYTKMVDKYAVKDYVSGIIGPEYIIPTIGVWNKPEDIDWDSLPNQFVLKTTHGGGGGGVVICKDKETFNKEEAIVKLNHSLKADIYRGLREWPYKDVPKRIIVEKFMAPEKRSASNDLPDYKFFCFNGKVKLFKVDVGRFVEHHANYYSLEGKLLPFGEQGIEPDFNYPIKLPSNLDEMISMAERISQGEPFLRVDLYNINGKLYFGEITFFPASGLLPWTIEEADLAIGKFLEFDETNTSYHRKPRFRRS